MYLSFSKKRESKNKEEEREHAQSIDFDNRKMFIIQTEKEEQIFQSSINFISYFIRTED